MCCLSIEVFDVCLPGPLLHTRGPTGKRERESERDGSGEKDPAACSINKMQRQSAQVRFTAVGPPLRTLQPLGLFVPSETKSSLTTHEEKLR